MAKNENRMEEWKLLSLLALLSNYEYFSVQKDDDPVFYATSIERSCGNVLKFDKKFATPVYSDGEVNSITALTDTIFQCQIGEFTYKIQALRKKPQSIPDRPKKNWNHILDFADTEYINVNMSQYINEKDLLVLVADPNLMGELSRLEQIKIRRLINIRLQGYGTSMQKCRSVCFVCKIHDKNQIIYAGMYDLENQIPVTNVMAYNRNLALSMNESEIQKYMELWKLALEIYNKMFCNNIYGNTLDKQREA